jgi:dUTP pyrophosphatase
MLQVKLFYEDAQVPTRGSEYAAGYDLYSYRDYVVKPNECVLVDTGIGITVPVGTYGRVGPRSGVSLKKILINAGIIDADYCSIVKVVLQNLGETDFAIKKGDRIAQLLLEKIENPEVVVVEELKPTKRGEGGFGSTGI